MYNSNTLISIRERQNIHKPRSIDQIYKYVSNDTSDDTNDNNYNVKETSQKFPIKACLNESLRLGTNSLKFPVRSIRRISADNNFPPMKKLPTFYTFNPSLVTSKRRENQHSWCLYSTSGDTTLLIRH